MRCGSCTGKMLWVAAWGVVSCYLRLTEEARGGVFGIGCRLHALAPDKAMRASRFTPH